MQIKKLSFARTTFLLIALFSGISSVISLNADEISHKKAAEALLEATHTAETISTYTEQMEKNFTSMPMHPNMNQQQQDIARSHQQNILAVFKQNINWEKMKNDFVTVYTNVYSEKDLNGLTEFYQSDLGKLMLEKTPTLMQQSMQITQTHMQKIMPELQKMTQDMMIKLQQAANR